ncbi:MAG: sensor histidine kinase, partial [Candidatus Thorarchaeota archaeon]
RLETNEMIMETVGGIFLVSCTPVFNEAGELDRIIHIATDMSARYRAEEELEAVLDIMAHDLRNRLQAALLGAEILNDTCVGTGSIDALDAITKSISSLGTIIEKVQSTRGFLNVPLVETLLDDVLLQAIKILRYRHPKLQVNININVQKAHVMADEFLENLLLNILENGAIHNTSEEKVIWVELDRSGEDLLITISDNGSGIPNYLIGGLFDSTRRFGGIGIQQSVRIAKKYGGRITYKHRVDEESRGAEFSIYIPSMK